MLTNRDKQVETREGNEPGPTGIVAPTELSVDGMVTHLTADQEKVLRIRAIRERQQLQRGW